MHRSFLSLVRTLIAPSLLIVLAAPLAAAQDARPDDARAQNDPSEGETRADPAARALDAIEEAGVAMAEWRTALEAGGELNEKDLDNFRASLMEFHRIAESIDEIRKRDQRALRKADAPIRNVVEQREQTQAWVEQMRAIGPDASEKRIRAIAELRAALVGDDPGRHYAALSALQQVGDVNYEKAQFRSLILPFVQNAKGHTFAAAAYALHHTGRQPGDLELIQRAWERRTAALDSSMSHLLFLYGDGKFTGRSEEIMLELLAGWEDNDCRAALGGLWGAEVTDRLAARVIEMADDPRWHHDAIYFGLSTLKTKNAAVVDKLIETLGDPDWNNWGRALWGLGYGVPRELQPKVAAALADMYAARSDPKVRETCRELIRQYAGDEAVGALPK